MSSKLYKMQDGPNPLFYDVDTSLLGIGLLHQRLLYMPCTKVAPIITAYQELKKNQSLLTVEGIAIEVSTAHNNKIQPRA